MPTIHLADRAVLAVDGPDAEHFLQNILTVDLDGLGADAALPGALLTPQGKILFDFLISRTAQGFRIDCRADIADDFLRRLMLYKLRAKVQIARAEQLVAAMWGTGANAPGTEPDAQPAGTAALRDGRFPPDAGVLRVYDHPLRTDDGIDEYTRLRITYGIAESGSDYALGDAFPHDVLLDQIGAVGFRKGCYVGQEVVSRMQHRGTARRRVLIATAAAPLPPAGTELTADGRPVGALGSVDGRDGLAIARIDRVKDAIDAGKPVLAGDVEVTLSIPAWAKFTFPAAAEGAEA